MRPAGLILALLAVTGSSSVVALRLVPKRVAETALAFLLVGLAEVVVTMLLAGALLDDLSPGVVVAVTVGVAAAAAGAGAAIPGVGVQELRRRAGSAVRRLLAGLGECVRSVWTIALVALVVVQGVWAAVSALVLPPYAGDALVYHLPPVAFWIQERRIGLTPYNLFSNVFPLNTELTFAWPAAILRRDALLNLGEFPFALLGFLALVVLARGIGLRRSTALGVGCLFVLTPIVLAQITTGYVDLAYGAELLACAAFFLRATQGLGASRKATRAACTYLALAGIAAGLALGSKGSAASAIVVFVVLLVVILVVRVRSGVVDLRHAAFGLAVFVVLTIAFGSYWYVRNWVDYSNPVYPLTVAAFGVEVFHGRGNLSDAVLFSKQVTPSVLAGKPLPYQVLRSWIGRPGHDYIYDQGVGGFGLLWPVVGLLAIVAFTVAAVRKRRDILVAVVVPFVAIFVLQPEPWWTRFTIMFVGLGWLAVGWAVDRLRPHRTAAVLFQGLVVLLVLVEMIPAANRLVLLSHQSIGDVAALVGSPRSERTFGQLVDHDFRWIDRVPQHATIGTQLGVVPKQQVYPLFGRDFSRRVVILPHGDPARVRRQIERDHVDYVWAGKHGALDAAMAQLDTAERIATTSDGHVYAITRR